MTLEVDGLVYQILYEYIKQDILSGKLSIKEKMSSKRTLAKNLVISTITVGNANELDAPGAIFSYASFVREQEIMLPVLIDIFENNTGVK